MDPETSTLTAITRLAGPWFIAVAVLVPIGLLVYSMGVGSLTMLNFVHVMAGCLWTGIDLFMGFVVGPVLGGMEPKERAAVFRRLIPKMTFLMPVVSGVTITASFELTQELGYPFTNAWIVASLVIVAILTIQGLGIMLPNEIRVFRQLISDAPDIQKISRLGMRTARVAGVQGVLQVAIIFVMANLRF